MSEILVPTEGHQCVNSIAAEWLAIDALFISISSGLDFECVFMGGWSKYFQHWLLHNAEQNGMAVTPNQLRILADTEHMRRVFDDPKNNCMKVIEHDIQPLRMVIEGVLSGASQKEAITIVSNALMNPNKIRPQFLSDSEFLDDLPRFLNHTSESRLAELWRKYKNVFHYILIWHAGFLSVREGNQIEAVPDAMKAFKKIAPRFEAASITKRLTLPEPTILKFVTAKEFADNKKRFLK